MLKLWDFNKFERVRTQMWAAVIDSVIGSLFFRKKSLKMLLKNGVNKRFQASVLPARDDTKALIVLCLL